MNKLQNISLKSYILMREYLPYVLLSVFFLVLLSGHAFADDYLSGIKTSVTTSFGEGSTFEHLLYLGEAIAGAYGYVKTKNIMLLLGVIVLMIFTHFAFALAMGTP